MSSIPAEYAGREQTYLKHLILKEYLLAWAYKLGSTAKTERRKLWFVDCFSGPWQAAGQAFEDTSIHIGLSTLKEVSDVWNGRGYLLDIGAVFVEKDEKAFRDLERAVAPWRERFDVHTLHGPFEEQVGVIERRIGLDPALLFVDPTGWNGAAMVFIARLARHRMRDVLINFMYGHIRRFKDDGRDFLRTQFAQFFGLGPDRLPSGLDEVGLLAVYRDSLKRLCMLSHAADLRIPNPVKDETHFRLVVGGHHRDVLEVFRDAEQKVLGRIAPAIRAEARDARAAIGDLFGPPVNASDLRYQQQAKDDEERLRRDLPDRLRREGPTKYDVLWPLILEDHCITRTRLGALLGQMHREHLIEIVGLKPRERVPKDGHLICAPKPSP